MAAGLKTITAETIDELVARAATLPRRRTNWNLHETPNDTTNRFLNVGTAGTYVRPHHHAEGRWEMVVVLRGRVDIVTFDAAGTVTDRITLTPGERPILELAGGIWHSFLSMTPSTVVLEVKPGPYDPATDKVFAAWAPAEGDERAKEYVAWLETARPGDQWY
jgi:cupin fold WbuC family metalloprotein